MKLRVLDTSITSLMFNEDPALQSYEDDLKSAVLIISFQTVAEMRYGALVARWGASRRGELESALSSFQLVEFSDALADSWAEVMLDARRVGRRLEAGDGWIAATARLVGAPLITHDTDFDSHSCPSIAVVSHARPKDLN